MRCAIVLVAACTTSPPRIGFAPDQPLQPIDLDIMVTHAGVRVFTNGTALGSERPQDVWNETDFDFPQPGHVGGWSDDLSWSTCLSDVHLEIGGFPASLGSDVIGSSNAVLAIRGCGGSARIPVGDALAPKPSASVTRDATTGAIAVTWSTDTPAATALIDLWAWTWPELWHVVDHDATVVPAAGAEPTVTGASVWTFSTVIPIATDYGVARVWTGDVVECPLPQ